MGSYRKADLNITAGGSRDRARRGQSRRGQWSLALDAHASQMARERQGADMTVDQSIKRLRLFLRPGFITFQNFDVARSDFNAIAAELERLRARVAELERDLPRIEFVLPAQPTAGCVCPGDETPFCQNAMCPRKGQPTFLAGTK